MSLWEYALWGAFGGLAVELIEFSGAIRRVGGWPWKKEGEPGPAPLLVTVIIRVGLGLGLAVAAAQSGQLSGVIGAIAVGAGAPLLIEQLAKQATIGGVGKNERGGSQGE